MIRCTLALALLTSVQITPTSKPARVIDGFDPVSPAIGKDARGPGCSGPLASSLPQHGPVAVYAEKVQKTFFVYADAGGAPDQSASNLVLMAGYYDHAGGTVSGPMLIGVVRGDARQNPTLAIDHEGYLLVFSSGAGDAPGQIFRSLEPYSITRFRKMPAPHFAIPQPWSSEHGLLVVHTDPAGGVLVSTTADGSTWAPPRPVVASGVSAFLSGRNGTRLGIAFVRSGKDGAHAAGELCYAETRDGGATWATAGGQRVALPVGPSDSQPRVFDYREANQIVTLKDLTFDSAGSPVVVYLLGSTALGENAPQTWATARFSRRDWVISGLITSDHPCDTGALYLDQRGMWVLLATTAAGPQPQAPGGDLVAWSSYDGGRSWNSQPLTHAQKFNHNGVSRPVNAQPDFYALWADAGTPSHIYFATQAGKVFSLPLHTKGGTGKPVPVPAVEASRPGAGAPPVSATQPGVGP